MRISGYRLRPPIAGCLMMMLVVPFGEAAAVSPQSSATGQQTQAVPAAQSQPQSPAAETSTQGTTTTPSPASPNTQGTAGPQLTHRNPPSGAAQTTQQNQQSGTTTPLGTAAAPYEKGVGVPASRPAGAAIAPAKQRRTRSFVIRVGLLVGAAIAVGTVAALSNGSPSRPN